MEKNQVAVGMPDGKMEENRLFRRRGMIREGTRRFD